MSDKIAGDFFNRPPRIQTPPLEGQITIPAPPHTPDDSTRSLLLALLPLSGILVMGLFYLLIAFGSNTGDGRGALFAIPLLAMGVVSVFTGLLSYSYQKREQRHRQIKSLRDYHRLLDRRTARLQAARDLQLSINGGNLPGLSEVLSMVNAHNVSLWERRIEDADFGTLRLGQGTIPSTVGVDGPDPDAESEAIRRAMDVMFMYRNLPNSTIKLNLMETGSIGIAGSRDTILPFVYALLGQLAAFHTPEDISLYLFSSVTSHPAWNWMR